MNNKEQVISVKQAYLAMYEYLLQLYNRNGSDDLGGLLGGMSLLPDGSTADPAAWGDWMQCVRKAREGEVDALLKLERP